MGNWALVIGCDEYWDPKACLRGAVRDALAMRSWFLDKRKGNVPKQNLQVLLGPSPDGAAVPDGVSAEAPTRDAIVLAIDLLLQRSAGDEGRLFLFYAGHGLTARVNGIDEPAIVPSDFTARLTSKAIPIRSIVEQFASSSLDEQFFFFDACRNIPFEGDFTISPLDRPTQRDYTRAAPDQYGCFATAPGLKAHETGVAGDESGAFTDALLEGLAGEGTAKLWDPDTESYLVRFDELFGYVEDAVAGRHLSDPANPDEEQRHVFQRPRRLVDAGSDNPVLATFADGSFVASALEIAVEPDAAAAKATLSIADLFDSTVHAAPQPNPLRVELQPRTYSVRATAPGFTPKRRAWPVELYGEARVVVTFDLAAGNGGDNLPETPPSPDHRPLRSPQGAPAAGRLMVVSSDPLAMVEVVSESGAIRSAMGSFEIEEAGRYRIRARSPLGLGPTEHVEVLPGDDEELEVSSPPGLSAMAIPSGLEWPGSTAPGPGDGSTGVLLAVADGRPMTGEPAIVAASVAGGSSDVATMRGRRVAAVEGGIAAIALPIPPGPAIVRLEGVHSRPILLAIYVDPAPPLIVAIEIGADGDVAIFHNSQASLVGPPELQPVRPSAGETAQRFARQGRVGDALTVLRAVEATTTASHALLGYLLARSGEPAEAIDEVGGLLIGARPDLPDGHVVAALAAARRGDLGEARVRARDGLAFGLPICDAGVLAALDLLGSAEVDRGGADLDRLRRLSRDRLPAQIYTAWVDTDHGDRES